MASPDLDQAKPNLSKEYDDRAKIVLTETIRNWARLRYDWTETSVLKARAVFVSNLANSAEAGKFLRDNFYMEEFLFPGGHYDHAISQLLTGLAGAHRQFSETDERDLLFVDIYILRTMGKAFLEKGKQEAHAKGTATDAANSDFMNAGMCYMKADELIGCITDQGLTAMVELTTKVPAFAGLWPIVDTVFDRMTSGSE